MGNPDGAPDIVVLWRRTPKARRPHLCDCCGEEITVGTVYESSGWKEDGEMKTEKVHRWAWRYPSGCPSRRDRDLAEIEKADPQLPRARQALKDNDHE